MDVFFRVLSLVNVVGQVLAASRDRGFQTVIANSLTLAGELVRKGHLPPDVLEGAKDNVTAIVVGHPEIKNPDHVNEKQAKPKPVKAASTKGANNG